MPEEPAHAPSPACPQGQSPQSRGKTLLTVRMPWHRRNRKMLLVGGPIIAAMVAGVGIWTYRFDVTCVDGVVPPWGLEVSVRDQAGKPIAGAALALYHHRRGTSAAVDDQKGQPLQSDSQGRMAFMCRSGGMWGGSVRRLFFVIPIEDFSRPEYDCEVTCLGYYPVRFRLDALRDEADRHVPNDLCPKMGLRLYQRSVVLKPRK